MISGRENILRAIRHEGSEWLPSMCDEIQIIPVTPVVDHVVNGYDWFGVKWFDSVPDFNEKYMEEFEGWQNVVKFPDLEAIDWASAAAIDCAGIDRENKATMAIVNIGLIERINSFIGIDGTMIGFYEEPEDLKDLFAAVCDFRIRHIEKIIQYYDPDIIMFHDDYGSQTSLFMSPTMWREFIKDNLRAIVETVHKHGKYFVMHSDGKIDSIVGDLVEIGIDVWDSVQPCCDYDLIFQAYGKQLAFMPTFDLQQLDKPNEKLSIENVHYVVEKLGGHNLLIPRDNATMLHPENAAVIKKEIRRLGREAYLQKQG